jgi:hypothetical protein
MQTAFNRKYAGSSRYDVALEEMGRRQNGTSVSEEDTSTRMVAFLTRFCPGRHVRGIDSFRTNTSARKETDFTDSSEVRFLDKQSAVGPREDYCIRWPRQGRLWF